MQRRLRKKYVKKIRAYILPLGMSLLLSGGIVFGLNTVVKSDMLKQKTVQDAVGTFETKDDSVISIVAQKENQLPKNFKGEVRGGEGIVGGKDETLELVLTSGWKVRLAPRTSMFFDVNSDLVMNMRKGDMWVSAQKSEGLKPIIVAGDFMKVRVLKGVIGMNDVQSAETVYVVDGEAEVSMLSNKGEELSKTLMHTGDSIIMTKQKIEEIRKNPVQKVITPLSADIERSPWYSSNIVLDKGGIAETSAAALAETMPALEDTTEGITENADKNAQPVGSEVENEPLSEPVLLYPTGGKITKSYDTLKGSVSKSTVRVDVNGYTLKKFVPHSGAWAYYLSADGGNMVLGKNTFTVVAYDEKGAKSDPLQFSITYLP